MMAVYTEQQRAWFGGFFTGRGSFRYRGNVPTGSVLCRNPEIIYKLHDLLGGEIIYRQVSYPTLSIPQEGPSKGIERIYHTDGDMTYEWQVTGDEAIGVAAMLKSLGDPLLDKRVEKLV